MADTRAINAAFIRFWAVYPLKVAKDAAMRRFTSVARDWTKAGGDIEAIVIGAERYGKDPNRKPDFTAHPATWLHGGRWQDEALPTPTASGGHASVTRHAAGIAASEAVLAKLEEQERLEREHEPTA